MEWLALLVGTLAACGRGRLNERHLRAVLREYVTYYNADRPHRSLDLAPSLPAARTRAPTGPIHARAVLGGLHHVYERAA